MKSTASADFSAGGMAPDIQDAVLLAAGFGERLRPITNNVPKCLVDLGPYNILENWLTKCEAAGVKRVFINTHYLAHKVEDFCAQFKTRMEIIICPEEELLGTAGTLYSLRKKLKSPFFLIHVDNFSAVDLMAMGDVYFQTDRQICGVSGIFETDNIKGCGIFVLDENGNVDSFLEKPETSDSKLANAALFLLNDSIFDFFPKDGVCFDFCRDVLPQACITMNVFKIDQFHIDIGTMENYVRARKIAASLSQ